MDPRVLDRLRQRLAALSDGAIGTMSVARGWITAAQLRECLREQARDGKGRPLGDILVEKRYLTVEQLADLVLSDRPDSAR